MPSKLLPNQLPYPSNGLGPHDTMRMLGGTHMISDDVDPSTGEFMPLQNNMPPSPQMVVGLNRSGTTAPLQAPYKAGN